ncbi:MAG: LytTR family DNA-binding domain-containing protein [Gemmataceae bacterium]|nr:LytTR family DNA-binding domain-containing protein [Gemmataceae bacterium]
MKIRTLVVDDEPLARQRLRTLLAADPELELVGECGDGRQAVAAVQQLRPDLMFLDVEMPALDGFGVLRALAGTASASTAFAGMAPAGTDSAATLIPVVIFVTAHDRYALKAFEVHALDYLLKPFDKSRFAAALERGKAQVRLGQSGGMEQRLRALLQTVTERQPLPPRLVVKSGGRVSFVRVDEVDWIEAAGNYVRLHVGKEDHLLRESLSGLEAKLDPRRFVRIHRSTIVNIDRIRQLQPAFHGDCVVTLRDGAELTLSRSYRDKVEAALGHEF